jgi:hypothetical protein
MLSFFTNPPSLTVFSGLLSIICEVVRKKVIEFDVPYKIRAIPIENKAAMHKNLYILGLTCVNYYIDF